MAANSPSTISLFPLHSPLILSFISKRCDFQLPLFSLVCQKVIGDNHCRAAEPRSFHSLFNTTLETFTSICPIVSSCSSSSLIFWEISATKQMTRRCCQKNYKKNKTSMKTQWNDKCHCLPWSHEPLVVCDHCSSQGCCCPSRSLLLSVKIIQLTWIIRRPLPGAHGYGPPRLADTLVFLLPLHSFLSQVLVL